MIELRHAVVDDVAINVEHLGRVFSDCCGLELRDSYGSCLCEFENSKPYN